MRLADLRKSADLYFDSGDAVRAGNVGVPIGVEPVWSHLERLRCTAGVPGNREFHVLSRAFRSKLRGLRHPLLAANLHWNGRERRPLQDYGQDDPLQGHTVFGEVGVFGVMVPMVTQRMAARRISAFVNSDPVDAARACVEALRPSAKIVVCLSHCGLKTDRRIARDVDGIDIVLGGHSHDLLDPAERIGNTWICQTGSHARHAGIYTLRDGRLESRIFELTV